MYMAMGLTRLYVARKMKERVIRDFIAFCGLEEQDLIDCAKPDDYTCLPSFLASCIQEWLTTGVASHLIYLLKWVVRNFMCRPHVLISWLQQAIQHVCDGEQPDGDGDDPRTAFDENKNMVVLWDPTEPYAFDYEADEDLTLVAVNDEADNAGLSPGDQLCFVQVPWGEWAPVSCTATFMLAVAIARMWHIDTASVTRQLVPLCFSLCQRSSTKHDDSDGNE